jgi:hypothetical protein
MNLELLINYFHLNNYNYLMIILNGLIYYLFLNNIILSLKVHIILV